MEKPGSPFRMLDAGGYNRKVSLITEALKAKDKSLARQIKAVSKEQDKKVVELQKRFATFGIDLQKQFQDTVKRQEASIAALLQENSALKATRKHANNNYPASQFGQLSLSRSSGPYEFYNSPQKSSSNSRTMTDYSDLDLDSIIDKLLEVRGGRPGRRVLLLVAEIRYLIAHAREIFLSQPILLELEAPIKILGDIRGQYYDLLRFFELTGFPPDSNYLFLGNYVDIGRHSLETICLCLAYKIKYPENFFMLRGSHECASTNRVYGFYDECKRCYSIELWKCFIDMMNCMPVAAIIDDKVLCVSGGISPDLNSMDQIRRVQRPTDIPDCGLLSDLLWSDPDELVEGWSENDRGVSFTFGPDVIKRFNRKHDLDIIVRGNQCVIDGYEFSRKRRLVTVWSAVGYRDCPNSGAVLSISESLLMTFQLMTVANRNELLRAPWNLPEDDKHPSIL